MTTLKIKQSVLHGRKTVDCRPRAPSQHWLEASLSLGLNSNRLCSSLASNSPDSNAGTSTISTEPSVLFNPQRTPNSQNAILKLQVSNSKSTHNSMIQRLSPSPLGQRPCMPIPPSHATSANRVIPEEGSISDSKGTLLLKDLGLNVRGHMIFQRFMPSGSNKHWQQSINTIRCSNDPCLVSPEQSLEYLMPSKLEKYALNVEKISPRFERRHRSLPGSSTGSQHVLEKITKSNGSSLSHTRKSWERFHGSSSRLGGNLLQPEGVGHKDEETIKEIRHILRQIETRASSSPEEDRISKPDPQGRVTNSPCSEYSISASKTKKDGMFAERSCFDTDHLGDGNECKSERSKEHDEDYKFDLKCKDFYPSSPEETPCCNEHTASDHVEMKVNEKGNPNNKANASGEMSPSLCENYHDQFEENVTHNIEHQNKKRSVTGGNDLKLKRRNHPSVPHALLANQTQTTKSRKRCKHQGLQVIDRIKTTQQLLAAIRVRSNNESALLSRSSSQESVTEDTQTNTKHISRLNDDKTELHRSGVIIPTAHYRIRQRFTRATLNSCKNKTSSSDIVADDLGGGDCSFKAKAPSHSESRLKEEYLASYRESTTWSDNEERILRWLRNVEPLVDRGKGAADP